MLLTFPTILGKQCFLITVDNSNLSVCPCHPSVIPCGPQSQLNAMKLNRLHAATTAPTPIHIKTRDEKGEVRPHTRAHRVSSDDSSRAKTAIPENRITTIPELTESLGRRLCLREKKTLVRSHSTSHKYSTIWVVLQVSVPALRSVNYTVDWIFNQEGKGSYKTWFSLRDCIYLPVVCTDH